MDPGQRERTVFHKKAREERKRELQQLLQVPNGLDLLTLIYKVSFTVRPGKPPPPGPVMVARILSIEYPGYSAPAGP